MGDANPVISAALPELVDGQQGGLCIMESVSYNGQHPIVVVEAVAQENAVVYASGHRKS
jgi:hypothetical protein